MSGPVRGLTIIGVKTDFTEGTRVISRVADLARSFAGVLTWEVFGDEASGTLILISSYESEQAIAEWEDRVTEAGLRPHMAQNLEVLSDYALTPIETEGGLAAIRAGAWIQASLVASK